MNLLYLSLVLITAITVPLSAATPGLKKWEFTTGGIIKSSPALGTDGTIYVGSLDKNIYALDPGTGAKKWSLATGSSVLSAPAIGADGTVYIGSSGNKLYALDGNTGTIKWTSDIKFSTFTSPAVGADGTVFVATEKWGVCAIDGLTGTKLWEFVAGGAVNSSPAVGADGTVYVGSDDRRVYALDGRTGTKKWEFVTGASVSCSPTIGADGTVYIGSQDNNLYALDGAVGSKLWEFAAEEDINFSPVIGTDGTIYFGSSDNKVYALDGRTGSMKWAFLTGGTVVSSPAIAADGTLYVGSADKKFYALTAATGEKQWEFLAGSWISSSPSIAADGTVYFGAGDSKVYALVGAHPPAESAWPMIGRNAQHTANADFAGLPRMVASPTLLDSALHGTAVFRVIAGGSAPLAYRWQKDGVDLATNARITGSDANILRIADLQPADEGAYRVVVSNGQGSAASPEAPLKLRTAVPGELRWSFLTGGYILGAPAIGADGAVYVGSWDGKMYAIDSQTGLLRWTFLTGGSIDAAPAIALDGTIYIGSSDRMLYALEPATGAKKWEFATGGWIATTPAIGRDGTIYLQSDDLKVYALDPANGSKKWEYTAEERARSSPAIGPDGTVYVGLSSTRNYLQVSEVFALDGLTGVIKWKSSSTSSGISSSAAIGNNGMLFIGSHDYNLYAFDLTTGTTKWKSRTDAGIDSSPAVGVDGTVFFGSWDGSVYAVAGATGARKWEFATEDSVISSPAISGDGTVYVGSSDSSVYALDESSGKPKWRFVTGGVVSSSPAIGADGTVYVGSKDGRLYALFGSSGLAHSAWPMRGNNPRHTGRAADEALTILLPPAPAVVATGSAVEFLLMARGQGALRYRWRFNGAAIPGAQEPSLVLKAVTPANAGLYDVVVSDDTASITSMVASLTVNFVNQAPSFTKGADLNAFADGSTRSFVPWARAIRAGPDNESTQHVVFLVGNDHPELFLSQPVIDASGTLSFRTARGSQGTATLTVRLQDDGGTASGGQDTSVPQTFTITVLELEPPRIGSIAWEQGEIRIRWEPGPTLQWSTNLLGEWQDVRFGYSPYSPSLKESMGFFRLIRR